MRKVKRSEVAVLHLVLKKKWYDMIASGTKKEEYREAKPYWVKRIRNWMNKQPKWRHVIAFSCGYRKPDMFFPCKTFCRTYKAKVCLHPSWGEPNTDHFILTFGQRVELED